MEELIFSGTKAIRIESVYRLKIVTKKVCVCRDCGCNDVKIFRSHDLEVGEQGKLIILSGSAFNAIEKVFVSLVIPESGVTVLKRNVEIFEIVTQEKEDKKIRAGKTEGWPVLH